jgi:branched-chain amino acid transport system permease protein
VSTRRRTIVVLGGIALLYAVLYNIPGTGPRLGRTAPFGIVVLGAVYGAVTALEAIGLVLVYRANRFINFAYAALGGAVGLIAIGLFLEHGWPYFLVLPLGVAVGALVGALAEIVVVRRFSNASRLVLTVASIGLAQLLGGLGLLGSQAIGFQALVGGFHSPLHLDFHLGVVAFGGDQMLIIFIGPFVIAALAWFLLRTDAGVAVRAAADNRDRALLFGIPVRRLATIVWAIAGALATLGFILQAPFAGVNPTVASFGATELLPALAAAVIARMESLPIAFGAGIGLGVVAQVVRWNSTGTPTFVYVVYLVVIVGALLLRRDQRSRALEGAASSW